MDSDPAPPAGPFGPEEPLGRAPEVSEETPSEQGFGPLEVLRTHKDDGRQLIAYRRRPPRR